MSEWRAWPMPWMIQMNPRMETPYQHETVWIMRDEWAKPLVTVVREMHPMMNVAGLMWRPWDGKTIDLVAQVTDSPAAPSR